MDHKCVSSIEDFLEKKKELQEALLRYLDDDANQEVNYKSLLQLFDSNKIREKRPELYALICMISNIAENHHRTSNFMTKICKIILLFAEEIKQSYSNSKIFNFFKESKQVILFLIENQIITPDKELADIISDGKYQKAFYQYYFINEFKSFYSESTVKTISEEIQNFKIDNFDELRKIGQNEKPICQLIRDDSIDEFSTYINKNNVSYSSTISQSIFETNSFLFDKNPTLIEYSVFYRSNEIFKFLRSKNVPLNPSMWQFAIHGNNLKVIEILLKKKIQPDGMSYNECLTESIKCFHNEITNLIKDKQKTINNEIIIECMKYFNYFYFPEHKILSNINAFYELCNYNYAFIVEILINKNENNIDVNFRKKSSDKTCLILAAEKEFPEIVASLLKHSKINVNDQMVFTNICFYNISIYYIFF